MEAEDRANHVEPRWIRRNLERREITEFPELSAVVEPLDAQPVVQALHQQIDLLLKLQFDNGQAALARDAENVNHPPVDPGEGRNLRVDPVQRQRRIDPGYVL